MREVYGGLLRVHSPSTSTKVNLASVCSGLILVDSGMDFINQ